MNSFLKRLLLMLCCGLVLWAVGAPSATAGQEWVQTPYGPRLMYVWRDDGNVRRVPPPRGRTSVHQPERRSGGHFMNYSHFYHFPPPPIRDDYDFYPNRPVYGYPFFIFY